jgi:DNA-directed RNA polymerase subunit beta'
MKITKEFIKIKIASPQKVLSWTERLLPDGKLIGEVTRPLKINIQF